MILCFLTILSLLSCSLLQCLFLSFLGSKSLECFCLYNSCFTGLNMDSINKIFNIKFEPCYNCQFFFFFPLFFYSTFLSISATSTLPWWLNFLTNESCLLVLLFKSCSQSFWCKVQIWGSLLSTLRNNLVLLLICDFRGLILLLVLVWEMRVGNIE